MSQSVLQITQSIVKREGGYVNDPDDPGGPTKFGVTIHTMKRLGIDLDKDGDVDIDEVKALTRAHAADFVMKQPTVYDMYVNAGGNAMKILQKLTTSFGHHTVVDGALGPNTAAAVERAYVKSAGHFVDAYSIARRNYYYAIGDHRLGSRKYARRKDGGKGGWIRRAEEFMSPKYHLTDAQHQTRIARWG